MRHRIACSLLVAGLATTGCGPRRGSVKAAIPDAGGAGGEKPVLVDEMVASVQGRPITLSELEIEVRLERASKGDIAGALGGVSPADEAAVLPVLVDRAAVIAALRGRYGLVLDPHLDEVERRRLQERFGSPEAWSAFLARLDLTEDEVGQRLRRIDEAEAILDARTTELVHVDKQAVSEWMAANPGVSDRALAEASVLRERRDQKMLEVRAEARRKTAVRLIDPAFAPPSQGMASPQRTAH